MGHDSWRMIRLRIRPYYKELYRFLSFKEYEMNKDTPEVKYVIENHLCLVRRNWPGDNDIVRIIIPTYFYDKSVELLKDIRIYKDMEYRDQYLYRQDQYNVTHDPRCWLDD